MEVAVAVAVAEAVAGAVAVVSCPHLWDAMNAQHEFTAVIAWASHTKYVNRAAVLPCRRGKVAVVSGQ